MFLKIRSSNNKSWHYVFDITGLTVHDRFSVAGGPNEPPKEVIWEYDNLIFRNNDDLALIDKENNTFTAQRITCIKEDASSGKVKTVSVLFNTYAYLCDDKGNTVESFNLYVSPKEPIPVN